MDDHVVERAGAARRASTSRAAVRWRPTPPAAPRGSGRRARRPGPASRPSLWSSGSSPATTSAPSPTMCASSSRPVHPGQAGTRASSASGSASATSARTRSYAACHCSIRCSSSGRGRGTVGRGGLVMVEMEPRPGTARARRPDRRPPLHGTKRPWGGPPHPGHLGHRALSDGAAEASDGDEDPTKGAWDDHGEAGGASRSRPAPPCRWRSGAATPACATAGRSSTSARARTARAAAAASRCGGPRSLTG